MHHILNTIRRLFKRKRRISLHDIERQMPAEALASLQREAAFLRHAHGVAVEFLAEGEVAGQPKAVDAAVEAQLTARQAEQQAQSQE